jgi:TonB family protein
MKKAAHLIHLGLLVVFVASCGSDKEARRGNSGGKEFAVRKRPRRPAPAEDPAPQMKVENELGVVDSADVEATIEEHFDEVRSCYHRAGKAQRYAGGRVVLRFKLAGDGRAEDVLVVESNLGNYDVERCLVEVGRQLVFDAPIGNKATTFDYPVDFRSTQQLQVLDIDGMKIDHDVASFRPQLAACGQVAKEGAMAILYIEPNGFPGSVGLAASSEIDEDVGECIVKTIRHWRMSAVLPGHALRATFTIPPVRVSVSEHAGSSGAGHRKHR